MQVDGISVRRRTMRDWQTRRRGRQQRMRSAALLAAGRVDRVLIRRHGHSIDSSRRWAASLQNGRTSIA
jgi:hypothetical protein